MSVTSSMYTGIAGMLTASQGISVVGNNLANAATVGFKGSVINFEDSFYQALNTSAGVDQVGTGSSVASIHGNFSQGAMETTTSATDLAVAGNGWFIVENPTNGSTYYTRAGAFTFDSQGYLIDSNGYRVQGWGMDDDGDIVGAMGDIQIDASQSPPAATGKVTFYSNLDSDAKDHCTSATNPFFAMAESWDGTEDTPLGDALYEHTTTITVYDENGSSHVLTVYYDKVDDDSITNETSGYTTYEYIVTCEPDEDGRTIDGQAMSETSAAGLLMSGTMTFNTSGELTSVTAYTLKSDAGGDMKDLSNWTLADLSENGLPSFCANFTGAENASCTNEADARPIELNFGLSSSEISIGWETGTASNAGVIGSDYSNVGNLYAPELAADSTTSVNGSSSTRSRAQDGYPTGYLMSISVNGDGVIRGSYSNGQIEDLFVVGLANFPNDDGLERQGNNLYSATRESGEAVTGTANTGSFGSIESNTLEQSNVDMGTEMVKMITFQRVYDAASKVISTADTMLQTVIGLKR
ncbi:flagellar hook protein FlgE [Desulfocurvus sp. DL9XJH121]